MKRSQYLLNIMKMNVLDWAAMILLVVGGLNWGLVGLLNLNLVALVLGEMSLLAKIVYILVGLSALYVLVKAVKGSKAPASMPTQQM